MGEAEATFVLVHGANLGGWCWDRVRPWLERAGHKVIAPTLAATSDPPPTLSMHIEAVVRLIDERDLRDVVLVGHSYAGMVISGVADRRKPRLRRLVYLDAAVPDDEDDFASQVPGQSPEEIADRRAFFSGLSPDGIWLPPPPLELVGLVSPQDIEWVAPRLVPHPLGSWLEPLRYARGGLVGIQKTYVLATSPPSTFMGYPRHAEIAKLGGEWVYREIECGHAMMIVAPERTAELLMEAAEAR